MISLVRDMGLISTGGRPAFLYLSIPTHQNTCCRHVSSPLVSMSPVKSKIRLRQQHFDATRAHSSTGGNDIRRHWGLSSWLVVSSSTNLKEASADQTRPSFTTQLSFQWDSTLNWFSSLNWFQMTAHKLDIDMFWNQKSYITFWSV